MTKNPIILQDLELIAQESIDWQRFSGKTVLITGANGFLPAYMVETLLFLSKKEIIRNLKILALVRNISKARDRFMDWKESENIKFIVQDVCDIIDIKEEIHFIIHAASQASPKYYGTDPVGTLSANTIGTINLLKLAEHKSVESFIFFSSSEVYGSVDESKIPEISKIRSLNWSPKTNLKIGFYKTVKSYE